MGRFAAVALMLTACGRWGFDAAAPNADDDMPPPGTPDAPAGTPLLACNTPSRFTVGAAGVTAMAPVGLSDGFALFTVDMTGNLAGWRYRFGANDVLVAVSQNIGLGGDYTDTVGAAALGDEIVLAAVSGRVAPTGTNIFPLDGDLAARGPTMSYSELAGTTPLAVKGGELVFIASRGTQQVDARKLSTLGVYTGALGTVADASRSAGDVGIAPAANGWIATWVGATASPNMVEAAVLDDNLAVTAGPFSANPTTHDPARLRVAWAKDAGVYLATWYAKNDTNDDDIWIQLFDAALAPIGTPAIIAGFSYGPSVVSDGSSFWVAWNNYTLGALETARVSPDGTVSSRATVADSGGDAGQWSFIERAGQVVLVWTEVGGSGGDLWLSAVCP